MDERKAYYRQEEPKVIAIAATKSVDFSLPLWSLAAVTVGLALLSVLPH